MRSVPKINAGRLLVVGLLLFPGVGCTICASPHDREYAAFGGRLPRTDMCHGRVNSIFSDPGVGTAVGDEEVIYQSDIEDESTSYEVSGEEFEVYSGTQGFDFGNE